VTLQALEPILESLHTAYAVLAGPALTVQTVMPRAALWLGGDEPASLTGQPLTDLLPEIIGQEEEVLSLLQAPTGKWELDQVARTLSDGRTCYLRFTITPYPQHPGQLLLLITDRTAEGRYLQELMQNRNELSLVRTQLAQSNAMLDFLLKRYLDPKLAEAFLQGELKLELGGVQREVSVLFADARGYTSFSEHKSPAEVVEILNNYLNLLADAIDPYGGLINQFQGDNMMVIFNARGEHPQHARTAVEAAISIQRALKECFEHCAPDVPRLHFGIGINSGPALVGNIGARWHYNFTAIGDTTNLASRITAAAPADEIWISDATCALLNGAIAIEPLPPMQFKGKSAPTSLYRVRY